MLKFLAKVWIGGELNDYRRNRKAKKKQQKINKQKERERSVAELGEIDEIISQNTELKKQWEKTSNILSLSVLIFIVSFILGLFIFPFLVITVIDVPVMVVFAIKVELMKKKILNK